MRGNRALIRQDTAGIPCARRSGAALFPGEDGSVISGPDIITRGFVYVKESEGLMEELRRVAVNALENCRRDSRSDWAAIKTEVKNALSNFLYKKTKRNPMILPVIMEV